MIRSEFFIRVIKTTECLQFPYGLDPAGNAWRWTPKRGWHPIRDVTSQEVADRMAAKLR